MALERKILTIKQPTIGMDELSTFDSGQIDPKSGDASVPEHQMGGLYPLVEINKYKFTPNELRFLRIDCTEFVPRITVNVITVNGVFLSKYFPKDGDPMSVFIRSKMDEFKPIRADFDITHVNSAPSTDDSGEVISFTISGVLRVPGLFSEHCKGFEGTSFDALGAVASELGLGFASNETSTDDRMRWLCPYDTYEKFIREVTMAAYKNEDTFYQSFIDHYYILNMVNPNTQLDDKFEVEEALEVLRASTDNFVGHRVEKTQTVNLLTNHENARGMGNYISRYTLLNSAGQVVIDNGYRRFAQFYDSSSSETPLASRYKSHFVEPLVSEGTETQQDKIVLRGRGDEAGKKIVSGTSRYKWLGLQSGANSHDSYSYALVHNWQNGQELGKLVLHASLHKCNFNVYRGQKIPVIVINHGSVERQKETLQDGQPYDHQVSVDKFLSGNYMVQGMKYAWDRDNNASFSQELYLTRREWPAPSDNKPKSTT